MGFYFADIYVCCMSKTNCVAPKNKFLAIVSTTVETSNPEAELKPGLDLLGKIDEKFIAVSDIYEPTNDGKENKVCFLKETQHLKLIVVQCIRVLANMPQCKNEVN